MPPINGHRVTAKNNSIITDVSGKKKVNKDILNDSFDDDGDDKDGDYVGSNKKVVAVGVINSSGA